MAALLAHTATSAAAAMVISVRPLNSLTVPRTFTWSPSATLGWMAVLAVMTTNTPSEAVPAAGQRGGVGRALDVGDRVVHGQRAAVTRLRARTAVAGVAGAERVGGRRLPDAVDLLQRVADGRGGGLGHADVGGGH